MNAQQLENREIWQRVKNSDKLLKIYTYYLTLHDAKIRNISINYEKREFSITVDYCDFIKEPGDEVSSRFTICWREVQNANFNWHGEDLYSMKFSKVGDYIKTKFTFGIDGELIAGEIEVKDIEIEPEKNKNNEEQAIEFSLA